MSNFDTIIREVLRPIAEAGDLDFQDEMEAAVRDIEYELIIEVKRIIGNWEDENSDIVITKARTAGKTFKTIERYIKIEQLKRAGIKIEEKK